MSECLSVPAKPDQFQTDFERALHQWVEQATRVIARHGERLSDVDEAARAKLEGELKELAKLKDDVRSVVDNYKQRFALLAAEHARGGAYRGPLGTIEQARRFGELCLAIFRGDAEAIERSAITSGTGEGGGALVVAQVLDGIIRNVEQYGVFEQDAFVWPVGGQMGHILKRTGGFTIYYPDLGVAPSASDPDFAHVTPNLTTYQALTYVDRSMFQDELAVPLADFIAEEMGFALAYGQDLNAFVGDGSSSYGRVTGLFNRADTLSVQADTGDDTFQEVIDASTKYLAKAAGAAPQWADAKGLRWYMHRSILFGFMGVRDSQNRPIVDMIAGPAGAEFYLLGYPVRITQVAPSLSSSSQANKAMAVLSALRAGMVLARHRVGAELRQSTEYKFAERQVTFSLEVRQDIQQIDGNATVQLKTASS